VPGIEGVGVVDEDSGLRPGQRVATMMGGMGRSYDGAYVTAVRWDATGRIAGMETTAEPLSGATAVLAAGVATAALGAPLGVRVPVEPSPCPLFGLRARAGLVRTVVNTEDFDLRQVPRTG
jgi:glycine/D-amino acid oxidase-like deaminating enzyme